MNSFVMMLYILLWMSLTSVFAQITSKNDLEIGSGEVINFNPGEYLDLPQVCSLKYVPHISTVGSVSPKTSICGQNLTYSHFGSDQNQDLDFFILIEEKTLRGSISVKVVKKGAFNLKPLLVEKGKSVTLNENINVGNKRCTALIKDTPNFGAIRLRYPGQLEYNCDNLKYSIVYKHFEVSNSNDSLTIKITLHKPYQIFYTKVPIYVKSNNKNTPPEIINDSSFWKLKMKDDSTKSGNIFYRLDNPSFKIVSVFSGKFMDGFYQDDIDRKAITILPSQNGNLTINLKAYDEQGAWTEVKVFLFVGNLTKYRDFTMNQGLTIFEGNTSPLSNFPLYDTIEKFKVLQFPKLGNLTLPNDNQFTLSDVIGGKIMYKNNNLGKGTDSIIIEMENVGIFLYPIFIVNCDKFPPFWKGPKEMSLKNNEVSLSQFTVSDPDSSLDEIRYQLLDTKYGEIISRNDGMPWFSIKEWRHTDILDKKIYYRLVKRPVGGGVDKLTFIILDSALPPNKSPIVHVNIHIPKDITPPRLYTNPGLIYREDPTQLKGLEYTDIWPKSHIVYHMSSHKGHFVTKGGIILSVFTQEMIDKGVIYYKHKSRKEKDYEIIFTVSDGDGNKMENQVLKVHVLKEILFHAHQPEQFIGVLRVEEGGIAELSDELLGQECGDVDFHVEETPKKGLIMNDDVQVGLFNCSALLMGDIYYEHNSDETGPNKIFDRFSLKTNENVKIIINVVINPVDDFLTEVLIKKPLKVQEGSSVKITTENLEILDLDTFDNDIICDIVVKPVYGVVNTFRKSDFLNGKVFYTQNVHEKLEPERDCFSFYCHDSNTKTGNKSTLQVNIIPVNDEPPVLTVTNITKKYAHISELVYISDMDTPSEQLTLGIIKHPRKGIIEKKFGNMLNFTMGELPELFYENFGGSDSFVLAVSDGDFLTASEIFVHLTDFFPLIVNKGLDLGLNKNKLITDKELLSEIQNVDKNEIFYIIKNPPMFGVIFKGNKELTIGDKFTQEDVSKSRTSYTHTDGTSLMDVFVFDVSHGSDILQNQNFFITVHDDKLNFKVLSKKPVVKSNSILIMSDDMIWIEPKPSDKKKINFRLVSQTKLGKLEYLDGKNAQSFDLNDLVNKKIKYTHKSEHGKQEILQFEVSNGLHRVFHSMTIIIENTQRSKIVLIKNKPLIINIRNLTNEKSGSAITKEYLFYKDSEENSIEYEVKIQPESGVIFNSKLNTTVNTFTQGDIDNELIFYYLKNGSRATSDSITLDLKTKDDEKLQGVKFLLEMTWINFKSNIFVTKEENENFQIEFTRDGYLSETSSIEISIEGGNATSEDFIFHDNTVIFKPGETQGFLKMKIENDDVFEGTEFISLKIKSAQNALIGKPDESKIFVSDIETFEDEQISENQPLIDKRRVNTNLECKNGNSSTIFKFYKETIISHEDDGEVSVEIIRDGHLSQISVLCYTEDNSANNEDFEARNKDVSSNIYFGAGETRKNCTIKLKNDENYEGEEDFTVYLKCSDFKENDKKISANVLIKDEEDEEAIKFEKDHYFTQEANTILRIPIIRKGDSSYGRHVKVSTENGTAKSGLDFISKPIVLTFEPKMKENFYEIEILADKLTEGREFFIVNLVFGTGKIKKSQQAIVYISDSPNARAIMFPGPPVVQSLKDYSTYKGGNLIIQGYPIVCVSVCNLFHPRYEKYRDWCINYNVTAESSLYWWQIEDLNGELKEIQHQLYFTSINEMVLDSVYFRGGYKLRCGVRPVIDNIKGKISHSHVVEIDRNEGICPAAKENLLGAEPFMSHISYMDLNGTKTLKLSVTIPHFDGLFPVVSTKKVNSEREILSTYPMRAEVHKCSNIIKLDEAITKDGFINHNFWTKFEPNQFNEIRGNETLRFYKHLSLKSCLWSFEGYFTLYEVVNLCGATVKSNSNMENDEASVLLELPLHIYYFTTSHLGWQQIHSTTTMRLEFTYKTSTIIKGDMMKMDEEKPKSYLLGTNMFISPNGSLVVHFKTKPKFNGYFLKEIPGVISSNVRNEDRPELGFTLTLLGNLTEGPNIEQSWMFYSDMASVDYSGNYEVTLIPCVSTSANTKCTPKEPIVQYLQVQFQQISDPVLHKYSLDTDFKLKKRRGARNSDIDEEDASIFEPGDFVHGKIEVTPPQEHLTLNIKKCFICAGKYDYTPKYDPQNREFGCLMDSPSLFYSLKLIDRDDINSVQRAFYDESFNATLTDENCGNELQKPDSKNCDSFIFDATPLFKQPLAKIWFIHCTYSITIPTKKRVKRNPNQDQLTGWNMHRIMLKDVNFKQEKLTIEPIHNWYLISLSSFLGVLFIFTGFILVFLIGIKKELKETKKERYSYVSYNNCKSEML